MRDSSEIEDGEMEDSSFECHESSGDDEEVKADSKSSKTFSYMSTNLLWKRNMTLADVEIESYTLKDIETREKALIK